MTVVAGIVLASFAAVVCVAIWKNWQGTALVFGVATLLHGCALLQV
jgi:hypothetical protein